MVFNIGDIFALWEQYGLYDFVLPFLLIFVMVYGILQYMKIFKGDKGISVLIALVLGLMATRLPFMANFLKEISPRLGVGLIILLTILILIGLFTPEKTGAIFGWIFIGVGLIILLIILGQVANTFGFGFGGFFNDNLIAGLLLIGLLVGVIVAIVTAGSSSTPTTRTKTAPLYD